MCGSDAHAQLAVEEDAGVSGIAVGRRSAELTLHSVEPALEGLDETEEPQAGVRGLHVDGLELAAGLALVWRAS